MAEYPKDNYSEFVSKKGENESPVDACKSWVDPCDFCDKRFGEWIYVNDDVQEKIPERPGFFMTALRNKNVTEIVNILHDQTNIRKAALSKMNRIREQISDRKNKATKSVMFARWMIVKDNDDKENSILCAHWRNNGVLPKLLTTWPGQRLIEKNENLVFSNQSQKWCYRQKNPIWRKPKPPPSKNTEEVTRCNFQSCEICDSYFTPWKNLTDVIQNNSAPNRDGLVMLSVVTGKNRNVLVVNSHRKNTVVPIKSTVKDLQEKEDNYLKEYINKNPKLEIRWMIMEDVDSDNSCFLYAHWLNADKWPRYNYAHYPLPGETSLNKNKHFIFHTNDKKWFYEIEAFKSTKFNKLKSRRMLFDELEGEDCFDEEQS